MIPELETHKLSELFPPMGDPELDALASDIGERGLLLPITLYEGKVLDGRNRLAACERAGVKPRFEDWRGDDPIGWIVAVNQKRRHLTTGQLAAVGVKLKVLYAEQARERQGTRTDILPDSAGSSDFGNARDQAGAALGIPGQRIDEAAQVQEVDPDLFARLLAGGVTLNKAHATVLGRRVTVAPPPPEGKYRCIVIDPPWPVAKIVREVRPKQGPVLDYPVMTIDEIAALPIAELAATDGCHVYLWVTHRFLPAGFELLSGWGVSYECLLTWVKNVGITPFSWMYSTEHVLFGRIGNLPVVRKGLRLDFSAASTRHSEKPDVFYERVCEASPPPRLELFARRIREGFKPWGDEVAA